MNGAVNVRQQTNTIVYLAGIKTNLSLTTNTILVMFVERVTHNGLVRAGEKSERLGGE